MTVFEHTVPTVLIWLGIAAAAGILHEALGTPVGTVVANVRDQSGGGILPGGLNVRRRAKGIHEQLVAERGLNHVLPVFNCNGHGQAGRVSDQQSPDRLRAKLEATGFEE